MKMTIHKADSRGYADHGWLQSHHTFSFANYYEPSRIRFGLLRVLNDDVIAPGMGFGTHPHDNMEIVTIPLTGELAHKDSTGHKEVIRPGEVQIMSAGSGLTHSEYNNSDSKSASLLQIWVFPKKKNIEPRYDQKKFSSGDMKNKLKTVVSPKNDSGALWINQDSYFSLADIDKGNSIEYDIQTKGNGLYVFVISGRIQIDNEMLDERDAVGLEELEKVKIESLSESKVLLIEVPMH